MNYTIEQKLSNYIFDLNQNYKITDEERNVLLTFISRYKDELLMKAGIVTSRSGDSTIDYRDRLDYENRNRPNEI